MLDSRRFIRSYTKAQSKATSPATWLKKKWIKKKKRENKTETDDDATARCNFNSAILPECCQMDQRMD